MIKRLIYDKHSSKDYISWQKKMFKAVKNKKPDRILPVKDFFPSPNSPMKEQGVQFLGSIHVRELWLLAAEEHIYEIYKKGSSVFYYDYS